MHHAGPPTVGRPSNAPANSSPIGASHATAVAAAAADYTSLGKQFELLKATGGSKGRDEYLIGVSVSEGSLSADEGIVLPLGVDRDGVQALLSPVPVPQSQTLGVVALHVDTTIASSICFVLLLLVFFFHEVEILEVVSWRCPHFWMAELVRAMVGGGRGRGERREEHVAVAGDLEAAVADEGLHADE